MFICKIKTDKETARMIYFNIPLYHKRIEERHGKSGDLKILKISEDGNSVVFMIEGLNSIYQQTDILQMLEYIVETYPIEEIGFRDAIIEDIFDTIFMSKPEIDFKVVYKETENIEKL